jgi:hypothetical protein
MVLPPILYLVGPDPLLGDQLISLGFSEFAIAATVLELDEPALLDGLIVSHGSCKCFDDVRHTRMKTRGELAFPYPDLVSPPARQEGVASVVACGVSADLVSTPSTRSPIFRRAAIYVAKGVDQKAR